MISGGNVGISIYEKRRRSLNEKASRTEIRNGGPDA